LRKSWAVHKVRCHNEAVEILGDGHCSAVVGAASYYVFSAGFAMLEV
jgi:hypothetical protein